MMFAVLVKSKHADGGLGSLFLEYAKRLSAVWRVMLRDL